MPPVALGKVERGKVEGEGENVIAATDVQSQLAHDVVAVVAQSDQEPLVLRYQYIAIVFDRI